MSSTHSLFGTDGIRGQIGAPPFTSENLPSLARAIAQWISQKKSTAIVAIAGDTRTSTAWIQMELANAFIKKDVTVHLIGTVPTPALSAYIQQNAIVDYGIMVTASHNRYHDNGIKIMACAGKLSAQDEQEITDLYRQQPSNEPLPNKFGQLLLRDGTLQYLTYARSFFNQNFLQGHYIIIDCAHGATSVVALQLFESLGATVKVINAAPNGTNINCQSGALHPQELQQLVIAERASAGFAFDGDGDRITTVTSSGTLLDGDDLIALLAQHPHYAQQPVVVGTIMSNLGLEKFITKLGKQFIRTAVGDKYVHRALVEQAALLGGEHSGHIIMNDYLPVGDGIFAALRYLELLVTNETVQTFTRLPQVTTSFKVTEKRDLSDPAMKQIIESFNKQLPHGRTVIRYSGTEPVMRVMVEDKQQEHAQVVCNAIVETLKQKLS